MSRTALIAAALLLGACGTTPASLCRDHCDKRADCGQTIDLSACHRACDDASSPGSAACQDADEALQSCQLKLACDAYLANQGCDAERSAMTDACR